MNSHVTKPPLARCLKLSTIKTPNFLSSLHPLYHREVVMCLGEFRTDDANGVEADFYIANVRLASDISIQSPRF